MWNGNGEDSFLHIRKGVTQGVPLAMVAYDIGILPLVKKLKEEFTDITQPWFADNYGALGKFSRFRSYSNVLKQFGSGLGCYPKPS